MQLFTITAFAVLAAVSSAQSLNSLPACAQQCVGNSLGTTGCKTIDIGCICRSSGWIAGLSCCIAQKCDDADKATTIQFANQICQVASVSVPTAATCSGGASSTAAPASTGAATVGSSTMSMSSGSVMSSASGSMATTGTSSMPATGSSATTASGTASTTASANAISTAGAAHLIGQGMGAAGAAVAALAFL